MQKPNEMYRYTPNVEMIRAAGHRIIRGRIPREVRTELMAAVKAGELGHLKKDGLKPEIFFHTDHLHLVRDLQRQEAEYAIGCIAKVMASPAHVREGIEAMGRDVLEHALRVRAAT